MKYVIKTFGKICHFQFSNISDSNVYDIEFGKMDYNQIEETFLKNKSSFENQKICIDEDIKFEIFDNNNIKILEFYSNLIKENDRETLCFCPEPRYNIEYNNCIGSLNHYTGGGPIFEFESIEPLSVDLFSFSLIVLELDDGEISLINNLYFKNKRIINTDFDESWGLNRFVKVWKRNGNIINL